MIKNVVIAGLGAVGTVYAAKIQNAKNLRGKEDRILNGKAISVEAADEIADLIIISTKFYNIEELDLKPFIKDGTIILSLVNGITSEEILQKKYPKAKVIKSYLICNSMMKTGKEVTHDGKNLIVMDSCPELEQFFTTNNIKYRVSENINQELWNKFALNICVNQLSAITRKTFGEMNELPYYERLLRNILVEVSEIAKKEGAEIDVEDIIKTIKNFAPYGKTSMLQDIENNRKTEIEAFAGTIKKLGEKHGIKTPYNDVFYLFLC